MRITDEKINAYQATFEISYSRYEYVGGGSGFGTSYYLFILPKTTVTNVSLISGFIDDPNSQENFSFSESVKYSAYSSKNSLSSIYSAASKLAVNDKSKIEFTTAQGLNEFRAIYFTDSRDNRYIIVWSVIKSITSNVLLSASCTTLNAIIADSWFLLRNGEAQNLMCSTPVLIKPNHQQSITVGSGYTIEKPGIVYYVNSSYQPKIMIVNVGDQLTTGGFLYYLVEIA